MKCHVYHLKKQPLISLRVQQFHNTMHYCISLLVVSHHYVNSGIFFRPLIQRSSQLFQEGGHVDHLRGHQDHLLHFFIIFNLQCNIYTSSVRSGSLICWVIDPRPFSYLEHYYYFQLYLFPENRTPLDQHSYPRRGMLQQCFNLKIQIKWIYVCHK